MKKLYFIISIISIIIIITASIYYPFLYPNVNETIDSTVYDASFTAQRYIPTFTDSNTDKILKKINDDKYQTTIFNLDTKYHDTPEEIMKNEPLPFGAAVVQDQSGNLISIPNSQVKGTPIYYDPTVLRYNPQSYVPTYEDTMYLRSSTPSFSEIPPQSGNFCEVYNHDPLKLEFMCQSFSNEKNEDGKPKCDMYDCCINLGGSKCVSGNIHGPKYKSNYGDIFIRNRDYYYYHGKCFGNCQTQKN